MLIFTRHPGQAFLIGDDIVITVLSIRGQQVRLGISAPKGVAVHREEIYKRIQQNKIDVENDPSGVDHIPTSVKDSSNGN